MADTKFVDKQKILKFIASVPFTAEDKQKWQAALEENELDEELLNDLHNKLLEIPQDQFASGWMRLKYSMDLKKSIEEWRMHNASRQFKHGH